MKLNRLLQGVLGYAMLVILGFAVIKVKTSHSVQRSVITATHDVSQEPPERAQESD